MQRIYIFLVGTIIISISVYLITKRKNSPLYSFKDNTRVEYIKGNYNSKGEYPVNITNEKFGSFSIGAALKTPIIYNYGNESVDYEGVA